VPVIAFPLPRGVVAVDEIPLEEAERCPLVIIPTSLYLSTDSATEILNGALGNDGRLLKDFGRLRKVGRVIFSCNFVAARHRPRGLANIKYCLTLVRDKNIRWSIPLNMVSYQDEQLAMLLAHERSKGGYSFYAPYIDMLPSKPPCAWLMDEEELDAKLQHLSAPMFLSLNHNHLAVFERSLQLYIEKFSFVFDTITIIKWWLVCAGESRKLDCGTFRDLVASTRSAMVKQSDTLAVRFGRELSIACKLRLAHSDRSLSLLSLYLNES
jgi:hypothetical protein